MLSVVDVPVAIAAIGWPSITKAIATIIHRQGRGCIGTSRVAKTLCVSRSTLAGPPRVGRWFIAANPGRMAEGVRVAVRAVSKIYDTEDGEPVQALADATLDVR